MKRKAICIFALIAYVLLFCTCVAPVVEREMATLAEVKHVKKNTKHNTDIPSYAYHWADMDGLFQIKEGSGWNTGSRVEEIPKIYYNVSNHYYSNISLHPENYDVILSASRVPKVGDRVEEIKLQDSPNEKIIIYCPEGYQEIVDRKDKFTVLGYGEKGILMNTSSSPVPFFESFAAFSLENRLKAESFRVYSYTDAENLLKAMPQVAAYGATLLFAVVVWFGTCHMTKNEQASWLLWGNAGILGASLLGVILLGRTIDLPASLMPTESIFDLAHYKAEYETMFAALREVGDNGLQNLQIWCSIGAGLVLLLGIALGVALLFGERKLLQNKKTQ